MYRFHRVSKLTQNVLPVELKRKRDGGRERENVEAAVIWLVATATVYMSEHSIVRYFSSKFHPETNILAELHQLRCVCAGRVFVFIRAFN